MDASLADYTSADFTIAEDLFQFDLRDGDGKGETKKKVKGGAGKGETKKTVMVQGMAEASQQSNQSDQKSVLTVDERFREKRCKRVRTQIIKVDASDFQKVVMEFTGMPIANIEDKKPMRKLTRMPIANNEDKKPINTQLPVSDAMLADLQRENGFSFSETEDELSFSVERCSNMSTKKGGEVLTEIPKGDEWIAPKICANVCKAVLPYTNMSSKEGGEVLKEIPKGDEWLALKICATVCKPVLPKSPNCPFLVALSLEGSKALMAIPSLFFEHMPVLRYLNLSHTSIRSLPVSLFQLVSLKELSLRHCKLFMELSPQVGQLHNLVSLDLDETQIAELPKEIGKLSDLKILRLSLDGYMNCGKQLQQNVLIHPGTIKRLSQLMELKIDVNSDNKDWNAVEDVVVEEACSLERLKCLILYLPNAEILGKRRTSGSSLSYYPLCRFRFTVGQHRQRIISRVPKNVEAHFQEWDKCLKFVKGNDISSEMKRVVGYTKAFYLERHASARSLGDFGIKNMKGLEFCILAECNEIQTIIDDRKPYEEEQIDRVEDEVVYCDSKGEAFSAQETVLLNLQYLHIYYLKNLVSIWRNPTYYKQCLSGLKVLELHVCPKLSVIFSPALLTNLGKLEVLVVEDCPELTCVVSPTSEAFFTSAPDCFLPSLKMMLLLFLPKLESISSDFHIAPKLEKIGFYDCPELRGLSKREMSSENLKVIKGEREWWEALEWDELEWKIQPDYLHSIFSPIDEDDDVMTQMQEMYDFGSITNQGIVEQVAKSTCFPLDNSTGLVRTSTRCSPLSACK